MGLGKKTIDDQNYCGKKVLVRCDFNVPMKDGVITNENRINAALPTIQKLVNDGAKVILCSHLGKPKNGPEAKFSLAPVAVALSAKLGKTVVFADDDNVVGENAKAAVAAMNNGDVVLLQNTRFRKEETKNLPEFSQDLASLADAYVDDAFGSCHRAHCSTAGVTDYIKDTAVGYLMEKEIKYLGNAVNDPVRPFTAILGGAKVADKLNVISNLLEKVDTLIIGGGMAYTFIKAQGYLLTNDGDLAARLTHPSHEVDKTYLARVTGQLSEEEIHRLRAGVVLDDGFRTSPAKVNVIRVETFASAVLITIHEGHNRQVRRMMEAVGHKVLLLRRVKFGPIDLRGLARGEWRDLTDAEVRALKAL